MNLELVIPVVPKDLTVFWANKNILFENLQINYVSVIGNTQVKEMLDEYNDSRIKFVDENNLYNYDKFAEIIRKKYSENCKKIGWYYQQFLKLLYCYQCENEYYLIWDGDTIPIKKIDLFTENGKPFFDLKYENHVEYFKTIKELYHIEKITDKSFISEHMIFKTSFVKKMIDDVKVSDELLGDDFVEKVMNVVFNVGYDQLSFSEYETYGTYVSYNYKDYYQIREWHSMRRGAWCFDKENITDAQKQWLLQYYDAVSFEKKDTKKPFFTKLMKNRLFLKLVRPSFFEKNYEKVIYKIYKKR